MQSIGSAERGKKSTSIDQSTHLSTRTKNRPTDRSIDRSIIDRPIDHTPKTPTASPASSSSSRTLRTPNPWRSAGRPSTCRCRRGRGKAGTKARRPSGPCRPTCCIARCWGWRRQRLLLLPRRAARPGNYVQACLLNRARQRRRLRRGCEDMANLYQHALIAEACPLAGAKLAMGGWRWRPLAADDPQGPLATWVEKETAWHMVSHLLMGFELELVEAGEVPMLYWYADFLLATCAQDLAALSAARPNPDRQQIYREQVMFEALRPMCQATFRLGLALNACGAIAGAGPDSSSFFATDAERFEMRFGFFGTSVERPEPLVFAQYQAAADI